MEDLSDRELEKFLQENISGRWFCGFMLNEDTPDHTVFTRARSKIGTDLLETLFQELRDQLKKQGYMNEVFTFVDASHLIFLFIFVYGKSFTYLVS
jgi:IS5 family transposase